MYYRCWLFRYYEWRKKQRNKTQTQTQLSVCADMITQFNAWHKQREKNSKTNTIHYQITKSIEITFVYIKKTKLRIMCEHMFMSLALRLVAHTQSSHCVAAIMYHVPYAFFFSCVCYLNGFNSSSKYGSVQSHTLDL